MREPDANSRTVGRDNEQGQRSTKGAGMAKRSKKRSGNGQALARTSKATKPADQPGLVGIFSRLARNPDLTVDKLESLIKLQERILDREAASAFDAAYRLMLPEIPRISKRGRILNKAKEVQSRYSKYEDIRRVCDPILRRHGFTFRTETVWPSTGVLEVVGILDHQHGGRRESRFRTTADESGGKNAIQGLGSGNSYGKRYTLKDLLSIVEEGEDDDGQAHGRTRPSRRVTIEPPIVTEPSAGDDGQSGEPITDGQLRRLVAIHKGSGRSDLEVKTWLDQRYGWSSLRQITRKSYDAICRLIEAPGALPL